MRTYTRLHADEVVMTVDASRPVYAISPSAVGWGAMCMQAMLWPAPPVAMNTGAEHAAYIEHLAQAGAPLARAPDLRNVSLPNCFTDLPGRDSQFQ